MTGGRLKRIEKYLDPDESFCFTYGDGLSDINLNNLINFHKWQNCQKIFNSLKSDSNFKSKLIRISTKETLKNSVSIINNIL